jgi:hypothetical protein
MHVIQLLLETLELLFAQSIGAAGAGEDERAARARRVVDQRLVPGAAGIVRVDGECGRLHRRQPIPIVGRVKEFQMEDRRIARHRIAFEAANGRSNAMLPTDGPTIGARDNAHAVGPKHVEL